MTNLQKHPKSGVYRFRRAVPEELRPIFGKTEIVETLGTKDLADAKRRVKEVGLRIDAMFEAARAGRLGVTIDEVQQFADAWKGEQLREDAQARLSMPAFTGTVTASIELFAHQAALEHRVREMKVALDRRDYRSVEPTASSLLARSGRIVDRRTEGYQALCQSLLQAPNRPTTPVTQATVTLTWTVPKAERTPTPRMSAKRRLSGRTTESRRGLRPQRM
jgi:hypothetical protein